MATTYVYITPLGPLEEGKKVLAKVDEVDPSLHPEHPIVLPPDLPPITELPDAKAAWHPRDDGWYFTMGPFAKPRQLGENCNLDPAKTSWTPSMNGMGWTLLSGPYDKPIPVFGEPDLPPDPPEQPPFDPSSTTRAKFVYSEASGWAFVTVTTFPGGKPRPPHLPEQPQKA